MLRIELEPTLISFLTAQADETAVAEPTSPSLVEAYGDHSTEGPSEVIRKPREESERNTKLTEEKQTADQMAESARSARRELPKRDQTLSEAYENITPDEDADIVLEQDGLPEALQGFDTDSVVAAMVRLGLTDDDLSDQRWVNALTEVLESEAGAKIEDDTSEEESEDKDPDEKGENEPDEKKPEEKTEQSKAPAPVAQFAPEELREHITKTFERSRDPQFNQPQLEAAFVSSLASALAEAPKTEEERVQQISSVVQLLEYGAMAQMETCVPALVNEYLQQNFAPHLMRYFAPALETVAPGIQSAFIEAAASNCWDKIRDENETFADLPDFESEEFVELRDKIRAKTPWLDSWDPGPNMPPLKALEEKAKLFARLAIGERVDPKRAAAQIAEAIETGKRSAQSSNRRVSASRVLRSGRTSGQMGREASERESLMDAFKRGGGGGAI